MSVHGALHEALRRTMAGELHYDLDSLSPLQNLRLDLAVSLRLELDRHAAAQARGEAIDLKSLISASEWLEKLLRPAELATTEHPGSESARRRMEEHILNIIRVQEEQEAAEWARLSEEESKIQYIAALPPGPAQPPQIAPPARSPRTEYLDLGSDGFERISGNPEKLPVEPPALERQQSVGDRRHLNTSSATPAATKPARPSVPPQPTAAQSQARAEAIRQSMIRKPEVWDGYTDSSPSGWMPRRI